jgi:hypothetical protein
MKINRIIITAFREVYKILRDYHFSGDGCCVSINLEKSGQYGF